MKKRIPALIAIVLILVIGIIAFGGKVIDRITYSKERADLNEYFNITAAEQTAIILQDEIIEEKAIVKDGVYYFDLATVHKYFSERFYADTAEGLVIFTTPTEIVKTVIGSDTYSVDGQASQEAYIISYMEGEQVYLAADYVKKYVNFSYEVFTEPNRMQVYTAWGEQLITTVNKNTAVRYRGGIKSEILTDVSEGTELIVLEEMEKWAKVKTKDGFIGYAERKRLNDISVTNQTPVTDYEEPEYTALTKDIPICLGWHVVGGVAGNDTLREVTAGTKGLNVISPTWFKLSDNTGGVSSFATKAYVDQAHGMGLEVWGLIDDFSYDVDSYQILSSTTAREKIVQTLMSEAVATGMDGINVDFEDIGVDAGEHFSQFLRELSVACRLNGLVLSVDNYVPFHFNDYYNRKEQGIVADYVIIMGYDEHWHGSGEPGSVASIGYVSSGIEKTLEEVPANKIINAVPFYSIVWKTEGTEVMDEYVVMSAVTDYVNNMGMTIEWDEETCQNYATKQDGEVLYQIWMEDEASLEVKLNVMKTFNIGGVAAWRLGYETKGAWDLISQYVLR